MKCIKKKYWNVFLKASLMLNHDDGEDEMRSDWNGQLTCDWNIENHIEWPQNHPSPPKACSITQVFMYFQCRITLGGSGGNL